MQRRMALDQTGLSLLYSLRCRARPEGRLPDRTKMRTAKRTMTKDHLGSRTHGRVYCRPESTGYEQLSAPQQTFLPCDILPRGAPIVEPPPLWIRHRP